MCIRIEMTISRFTAPLARRHKTKLPTVSDDIPPQMKILNKFIPKFHCIFRSDLQIERQVLSVNAACNVNRGSYISAHVLLNLLNELGKRDEMRGLPLAEVS